MTKAQQMKLRIQQDRERDAAPQDNNHYNEYQQQP